MLLFHIDLVLVTKLQEKICHKLVEMGVPNEWSTTTDSVYKQLKEKIKTNEGLTKCINHDIRVKHDCPLSHKLFGLYINKL